MKLYNEFEVKFAMDVARCQPDRTFDEVLEELTPIQLPNDEEVEEASYRERYQVAFNPFASGAKWMRDKIQGGNK
jgi:hypothetical protein